MRRFMKERPTMCRTMRIGLAGLVLAGLAVGGVRAEPNASESAEPTAGAERVEGETSADRSADASQVQAQSQALESAGDGAGKSDAGGSDDQQAAVREVAYLGVSVQPLGETLRAQLDLPEGVGLSVAYVVKGSPAEAAGLRRHDVLQKFGDQLLVSVYQLKVLVRVAGPGAERSFTLVRRGRAMQLPVELGTRRVPTEAARLQPPSLGFAEAVEHRRLAQTLAEAGDQAARRGAVRISTRQMSFTDGEHKLIVREDQQGRHLRAVNRAGEVLYEGYLEDAQGESLPPMLQRKLDRLEAIQQRHPMSGPRPAESTPDAGDR